MLSGLLLTDAVKQAIRTFQLFYTYSMKKILFSAILLVLVLSGQGQAFLENTKTLAKKEDRFILLNFSGSDWCIPCIQMQKTYFDNEGFKKMADSQLLIIRADFPRKKKNLPATAIVKENEWLAERFNPGGSFPLTILLNQNGDVIKRWDGLPDEAVEVFTKNIQALVQKKQTLVC